jgi:hypothetical protein
MTAVALLHFFFAWNDFIALPIYLAGKPNLAPDECGIEHL